ncbi:MAG: NAD-dependent epimerase/dehydratase family protein [Bryobacteraceae bacterium]|jgi:farnesol dehydrogenase
MAATLITGATGFIGATLAKRLADRGELVHALCRGAADAAPLVHDNIRVVRGDVRDPEAVERAMGGCDRVFHLAGYARNWSRDRRAFQETNVGGLHAVLETARRLPVRKVVFTSSALTLGPSTGAPVDESTRRLARSFTAYESSKLAAEELARQYARRGTPVTIVNPTRVFGPGLLTEGNSVTRMIQWYIGGRWRWLPAGGGQIGNWAFVDDVVRGHLLAMENGRPGETYILGGENASLKEFFDLVSTISGRRYRLFPIPYRAALTAALFEWIRAECSSHYPLVTPGWARCFAKDWACSSAKAMRELGYSVTPLGEGLRKTIEWLPGAREVMPCATR